MLVALTLLRCRRSWTWTALWSGYRWFQVVCRQRLVIGRHATSTVFIGPEGRRTLTLKQHLIENCTRPYLNDYACFIFRIDTALLCPGLVNTLKVLCPLPKATIRCGKIIGVEDVCSFQLAPVCTYQQFCLPTQKLDDY